LIHSLALRGSLYLQRFLSLPFECLGLPLLYSW